MTLTSATLTFLNLLYRENGGLVYYRYTNGAPELAEADEDASRLLAILDPGVTYNASLAIVVSFFRQTHYGGDNTSPVRELFDISSNGGLVYYRYTNGAPELAEADEDQDFPDQCPMPINVDQNHGIDPKCLSMLIIADQCRSIPINSSQCRSMPDQGINADQCRSLPIRH